MRRLLVVTLTFIAMTASAAATGSSTQTLRIVDRTPLVIEGRGFVAGRQVVVTVRAPGVSERRTRRANELGRFRVVIAARESHRATSLRHRGRHRSTRRGPRARVVAPQAAGLPVTCPPAGNARRVGSLNRAGRLRSETGTHEIAGQPCGLAMRW